MTKHAVLSPSGFKALMLCPGKPAMEMGLPDESSEYADQGTAAHFLGSTCLEEKADADFYADLKILVSEDYTGWDADKPDGATGRTFKVDEEMVEAVQVYVDTVRAYQGHDGELFTEMSLPIDHITGEEGAEGTSDTVICRGTELVVIDLKYGKGVEVSAEDNPQLKLYALGALKWFDITGDFETVRMVISQPRVTRAPSEDVMDVADLVAWGEGQAMLASAKATIQLHNVRDGVGVDPASLTPAEDACRFCKAKATCPKLEATVKAALDAEFTDLTTADALGKEEIIKTLVAEVPVDLLGAKMDAVALIEDWCKAIRGRVEQQLLAGNAVAGYKLVQGKQGNRAWADADDAEKLMKSMRLKKDEMYDLKLISPTTAEKILKDSPKRWKKVQPLITRSDGKPSVAPVSDKRAALEIKPVESEFSAIVESIDETIAIGMELVQAITETADDLV